MWAVEKRGITRVVVGAYVRDVNATFGRCGGLRMVVDALQFLFFFFQAEDGIRDSSVTGVQTCALPISQDGCCAGARRWPRWSGHCLFDPAAGRAMHEGPDVRG